MNTILISCFIAAVVFLVIYLHIKETEISQTDFIIPYDEKNYNFTIKINYESQNVSDDSYVYFDDCDCDDDDCCDSDCDCDD